ncbi:hypothetical protein ACVWXN_010177 [Bradyrhizobium sp. i1.4.4]|uniref:hypothetical protein n=1 Tax=Bradyrhizobium sp. LA6.10 TaxID=3156318 RepID=UPI0033945860
MRRSSTPQTASYTYANWRRAIDGKASQETTEALLFTDTWVTGEISDLGPYALINTIAHAGYHAGRILRPAIVMRVAHHYEPASDPAYRSPMQDDFEHYHGGDYLDEMAAIASLFLGIRLKAGGVNREFRGEDDRFGRPMQIASKPDPQLLLEGRPQIPRLSLPVNLNAGLAPFASFPQRTAEQTNALIKAARQYQQAVWIADSDPSLAWLMLVSAIETASLSWSSDVLPVEQLETAFPKLAALISDSPAPELLAPVAELLKNLTRSTKRFTGFVDAFAPPPPSTRPEQYMQFSYAPKDLSKAMGLIYCHRSKSLHSGTAFPLPMCDPPRYTEALEGILSVQEKPLGLAVSSRNASWKVEQTPMLLNTFEHIARGALLNWWSSLTEEAAADEEA